MKVVIQRVSHASVTVDNQIVGQIGKGLLVLFAVEATEGDEDIDWLVQKIVNLRIFNDENGVMNLSSQDIDAQILVISQFTLYAKTKKGNRPSYIDSAKGDIAIPIYEKFLQHLEDVTHKKIERGIFGADMKVNLLNDGPVTIIIDSKHRE